ncbi:MAG: hydrogenobyrinic acid a,c-diamide synthase (glutamine-hydrolyzing) [Deltaproteobacteria bacterium]|nr:hydrogenobyrinic acid a,c-diamide synthase (glutamine-hydrolyzing) [Deltaproteobacteria bacterium]
MLNHPPRITLAALKGGSGKTMVSVGLVAAWRRQGHRIAAFKKGPDFIDAGWLALAAGGPCRNLDPFLMTREQIRRSFLVHSAQADLSLIEGNRGLFDGMDLEGRCSTAELGRLVGSPVVLIVDVTMVTRTVAALVMGCQRFDPGLRIEGVILNRVAGLRQEGLTREAVERYCGIPVVGAIPKLKGNMFPERHMGLVPLQERDHAEKAVSWARKVVEDHLDPAAVLDLARKAPPLAGLIGNENGTPAPAPHPDPPRIGLIRDRAFWFYYPENIEQLSVRGAVPVEVDSLRDRDLPELDALYIGGGFPETQAEVLAENRPFRAALKRNIEAGLPVYAECGGLMYLGKSLLLEGKTYPMVDVLPLSFLLEKRPQGHGYTVMEVDRANPYFPVGKTLRGHEFHYSRPVAVRAEELVSVFRVVRGRGLDGKRDGLCKKNLLATYTHLHGAGTPGWAEALFRAALGFRESKK